MEIREHTVSLDLALALRDAGYPQQATFFRWIRPEGPQLTPVQKFAEQDGFILTDTNYSFPEEWEHYSAPLASELMEKMPLGYLVGRYCDDKGNEYYIADSEQTIHTWSSFKGKADSMPDAVAKDWLHLRKASLI